MSQYSHLKSRIIPVIQIIGRQVVKSRCFTDHRVVGNIEQTIEAYNRRNVDEIIVIDTDVSKSNRIVNFDLIQQIATRSLMPISYGGGISSLSDISQCLALGCDKVIINHHGLNNIAFIHQAMDEFGVQAITLSIDVKELENDGLYIYDHVDGTLKESLSDYLDMIKVANIGELFITSLFHDGMMSGYDLKLLKIIMEKGIKSPILFNGGCGKPQHMADILNFNVSACCGSSIYLYSEYSYSDIKKYLIKQDYKIRPTGKT